MTAFKPIIGILAVLIVSAALAWAGAQGSVVFNDLPLFFLCACVGFILHWLVFIPSYWFQTEHYFDLTGSVSYVATLALAVYAVPEIGLRSLVLSVLIMIWAVRLGAFLFLRVIKAGEDRRFRTIKTLFFRFLFTWTLGGAWVFITMAAALAAVTSNQQSGFDVFLVAGLLCWIIGFAIEVIADRQKSQFRATPGNKEKFITTGLWSVSRHPNYFGEILLWIGIAIIALPTLQGWQFVTLVSPLFVILLLLKVSGVPMLEAIAETRWGSDPAYQSYKASTPAVFPRVLR